MKLKLLLFAFLLSCGVLNAQQDTIQGLMITEAYLGSQVGGIFEITNMGDETVDLGVIEFGEIRPWGADGLLWQPDATRRFMLPAFLLEPGKSFVISGAYDFEPKQFAKGLEGYRERVTKQELWEEADMLIHLRERNSIPGQDSIFEPGTEMFGDISGGRSCFFIRQHINETDSVVLDQVGGVFDGPDNLNLNYPYDVAGVADATNNSYLIRKFKFKTGNLDFNNARGVGTDDSEWIVVPRENQYNDGAWRALKWTIGNHGNYKLDENTLESDVADVDFANKTITVPWGVRRGDGIMKVMNKKPGISWTYHVSPVFADSLSFAAKTGDQLEIFVCGDEVEIGMFDIIVADATADANIVVPVSNEDPGGGWRNDQEGGQQRWPRVTEKGANDSIWGEYGIPYATRVDSLFERLEKAPKASWEIVWVDGVARPDLKDGDILKVTAEDNSIKEYYIAVGVIRKNTNANLLSITWPDIPDFYKGLFGWKGDTIPSFGSSVENYRINVPLIAEGIPALVGKTANTNAKVSVKRASNLAGGVEERTISFTVQAEDDTTFRHYNVELVKEKNPADLQPYNAKPIISEYVFWDQWSNSFIEICNPGNQPMNLSDYMIVGNSYGDPVAAITENSGVDEWGRRYCKYVPGYKWVDEATWQVNPGTLVQDLSVNPMVLPGDVFVMAGVHTTSFCVGPFWWDANYDWPVDDNWDVQFNNYSGSLSYENNWNEPIGEYWRQWHNSNVYIFEILNDSVKNGLKPANDPDDFKRIEAFGMVEDAEWVIGGVAHIMITNFIRKPEIYKGNPELQASFGTNPDDTEWTWTNQNYWDNQGKPWPENIISVGNDLGKHFFNTPTHYMSTVSSILYKVSAGYSLNEEIRGLVTGATAGELLGNVIKADEGQTLKVTTADGSELAMDAILSPNDTLTVMSADSTNVSKYVLEVTDGGLSSDAVIVSSKYEVEIQADPKSASSEAAEAGAGTITGFEYGTSLKTVLDNITVPAGAAMDIINGAGAYVPLTQLNFDTTYVNVTVNSDTYFDVTAENGVTKIKYQLLPEASDDAAFITSTVYSVVQKDILINYVPRGTNVTSFLGNLVANSGATVQLVNKFGQERMDGGVADDDKVIVTSPSGKTKTTYFISMLAERYVPTTTYLAYITSKNYGIDQVMYKVNNVNGAETIAEFYSNITPSMGATAVVVDKDGTEKTSGDIDGSDMVKVTSADGKITVMYSFGSLTATETLESSNIELYPNPTNGVLNISGVERGNRIQIYNATGSAIRDIIVKTNLESVSLNDEPTGMYLIVISDNDELLGRYKAIKK